MHCSPIKFICNGNYEQLAVLCFYIIYIGIRAGVAILKLRGPDIRGTKYWGGPTVCFVLFSPNIGGARALPGHATTPALIVANDRLAFVLQLLKAEICSAH